jgi:hypothetical protein
MTVETATWIVGALVAYGAAGAVFALLFLAFGVGSVDPDAKAMPVTARIVVFPGAAALWPLMLARWLARRGPPVA